MITSYKSRNNGNSRYICLVNKADIDGADKTKLEIEMNLDLNQKEDYRPPVIRVSASKKSQHR